MTEETARITTTAGPLALAKPTGLQLTDTAARIIVVAKEKVGTPDPDRSGAPKKGSTHDVAPERSSHSPRRVSARPWLRFLEPESGQGDVHSCGLSRCSLQD